MVKNSIITLLFISVNAFAQVQKTDTTKLSQGLTLNIGVLASEPSGVPFWMAHNNGGRFSENQTSSMYSGLHYYGKYRLNDWLSTDWEAETMSSAGLEGMYGSIIQANFSVATPIIKFSAGLDEEFFRLNDSELSFGNLLYGNNALPLPKIRLETNGWLESPILPKVFSFKIYMAHGWFENNRTQSGAYLHQKYFYGRAQFFKKRLSLMGGFHDNAMWAGRNLNTEEVQPTGFKNFTRVLFGMNGGDDALQTDQNNALGNHLGTFDLKGSYQFRNFKLATYWQFLWEDGSGMTISKWRDGIGGLSLSLNEKAFVDQFVFELVRTNDQNAYKIDGDGNPFIEPDNFFNNGVYNGGWTYNNRVIGSPLFVLVDVENSLANNIQNMVNAFNIGIGGHFKSASYILKYKEFENHGKIQTPLEEDLFVKSIDLSVNYDFSGKSALGVRANYQNSNFSVGNSFAMQLSYRYKFSF